MIRATPGGPGRPPRRAAAGRAGGRRRARRCSCAGRASRRARGSPSLALRRRRRAEQPLMAHGMPRLDVLRAHAASPTATAAASGASRGSAARGAAPCELAAARAARRRRRARRAELGARSRSRRCPRRSTPARAARAAGRDLHGDVRAAAGAVPPPARVDPRADAPRLGLRRSATTARTPSASRDRGGASAATRASCVSRSPRRLGFYRNFERALALAPGRRRATSRMADQDDVWHPDKLDDAARRDRRRAARLQRRADRRPRRRADRRHLLEPRAATTTRDLLSLLVANAVTGRGVALPARPARRRAARSRRPSSPTSTTTGSRSSALALGRHRASSTGRSTTTSSTATRRSATPRRTACRRCATALARAAPRPARAGPAVADALLRRRLPADAVRRRCCALRCGDRMRAGQAARARRASSAPTARCSPLAGARPRAARASCPRPAARRSAPSGCSAYALRVAARCSPRRARDAPAARRLRLDAVPPPALDPRPGAPRAGRPGARARRRQDRAAAARRARRRAARASTC